jgi:hypothetical protein
VNIFPRIGLFMQKKYRLAILLFGAVFAVGCQAEETNFFSSVKTGFLKEVIDPQDGKLDVSEYLGKATGFLPIPILITEPAVGIGGGFALLFFHDSIQNRAELSKKKKQNGSPVKVPPPSVSGVAGFGTENGTWGGAGFHLGIWRHDTLRYMGALAYASINYDYYGLQRKIPVNVSGALLFQQLSARLGDSDLFLGANYRYSSATAQRENASGILPSPAEEGVEVVSAAASPILEYDSRDNLFTPNRGMNAKAEWSHYDTWLGSDNRFDILALRNRIWFPLKESWVLGLRLDGSFSRGDTPFYMLPFVQLRGIPAMRYQGKHVLTAEAELRWDFAPRWSLVGFAGAGRTSSDSGWNTDDEGVHPAGGFGFRYLIARIFKLRSGVDIGFGEEGYSIYFITGSAWVW